MRDALATNIHSLYECKDIDTLQAKLHEEPAQNFGVAVVAAADEEGGGIHHEGRCF